MASKRWVWWSLTLINSQIQVQYFIFWFPYVIPEISCPLRSVSGLPELQNVTRASQTYWQLKWTLWWAGFLSYGFFKLNLRGWKLWKGWSLFLRSSSQIQDLELWVTWRKSVIWFLLKDLKFYSETIMNLDWQKNTWIPWNLNVT